MMNHRVIASGMPRMASREAGERSPGAANYAEVAVRVKGILRTSRSEATRRRLERREIAPIHPDQRETDAHSK